MYNVRYICVSQSWPWKGRTDQGLEDQEEEKPGITFILLLGLHHHLWSYPCLHLLFHLCCHLCLHFPGAMCSKVVIVTDWKLEDTDFYYCFLNSFGVMKGCYLLSGLKSNAF